MFKKVSIRLLVLLLIITVLNIIYTHTFYKDDVLEKSKELLQIDSAQLKTDIFYFGESSNTTFVEEDSAKNSISEFVAMFFPKLKFTNINKNATHAGIYKYWLKRLSSDKKMPKAIIVTLNLRSFNAAWIHSTLENSLQESLVFARPFPNIVNRFLLSLQAFDNKTNEQREQDMLAEWREVELKFPYAFRHKNVKDWDDAMAMGGHLKSDGSWDEPKIELACHYIKAYAFNLSDDNVRVRDFDEIHYWCKENNVDLFLNLLSENIAYADSLVGKDLVFLMTQNRDFLVNRYQKGNCKVIDNLNLVPGREFIDQTWTTEHYKYKGRMSVAKNVADTLKIKFSNYYKQAY